MTVPPPLDHEFNPRMHQGGKLSFRGRGGETPPATGDRLVTGGTNPPPLLELVPPAFRSAPLEVEVGPGKGAFLVAATAARPDVFLLGIEAAPGYAAIAASKLAGAGRDNGLVLVDNGKLYLQDRVPEGALRAVHVYFPDPWPKRRHQGRRFFAADAPAILARVLADGGHCFVATDNAAYAGQIARVLGSAPAFARDEAEEAHRLRLGAGHAFSPTNFERKYAEEGRVIRRYAFVRLPRDGAPA